MHGVSMKKSTTGVRKKAQSASTELLHYIYKCINDGVWPEGHRLPTERELGEQFDIARNTLRKVLNQLESEGMITRHVGRGTFVASIVKPTINESNLLLQRIHGASPAEVMELRLLLEPQFVELAATRSSGRDLQYIIHCLEESEKTTTVLDFEYWDGKLHQSILAAAHNDLLTDLYEAINGVRKQPEWQSLKLRSLTPELLSQYRAQHRTLVNALCQRDAKAASLAVYNHLLEIRNSLIGEV